MMNKLSGQLQSTEELEKKPDAKAKETQETTVAEVNPYIAVMEERVEECERELEKRNESIFAIQRNFESVSIIARNLKTENEQLKQEATKLQYYSTKYEQMESGLNKVIADLKESLRIAKEDLSEMMNEDRNNKKTIQELLKMKSKYGDMERELSSLTIQKKELEMQIEDLVLLSRQAEKEKIQLMNANKCIEELKLKAEDKEKANKKTVVVHRMTEVQLKLQREQNKVQQKEINDLGEQKNYLCSLEAKHSHDLFKERQKVSELQEQLMKLHQQVDNQQTLVYLKASQAEQNLTCMKSFETQLQEQKERMERVEMLEKKVKDMERTCECSRFPKLFEECRKLRESSKDIDPQEFEGMYVLVFGEDHERLANLVRLVTRSQSNLKKAFQKMEEKYNELLKEQLAPLERQIHALGENYSLVSEQNKQLLETVKKMGQLSVSVKVKQDLMKEAQMKNYDGILRHQELEVRHLTRTVEALTNSLSRSQVDLKSANNLIDDLEEQLEEANIELKQFRISENLPASVISFNQRFSQLERIFNDVRVVEQKEQEKQQPNSENIKPSTNTIIVKGNSKSLSQQIYKQQQQSESSQKQIRSQSEAFK